QCAGSPRWSMKLPTEIVPVCPANASCTREESYFIPTRVVLHAHKLATHTSAIPILFIPTPLRWMLKSLSWTFSARRVRLTPELDSDESITCVIDSRAVHPCTASSGC